MMKTLESEVSALVAAELASAVKEYGEKFNSLHEAHAVALEKFEEASDAVGQAKLCLTDAWCYIKLNKTDDAKHRIGLAGRRAISGATELIQFAAMCDKAVLV